MDALTFATLVSLVADFGAHRRADQSKDFDDFMAWLSDERHNEILALLRASSSTAVSTKALLTESRQQILERLATVDRSLASVESATSYANRPWLNFTASTIGPLNVTDGEISATFHLTIKNVGNSPATNIFSSHELVITTLQEGISLLSAHSEKREKMAEASIKQDIGETLFPNDSIVMGIVATGKTKNIAPGAELFLFCWLGFASPLGIKKIRYHAALYLLPCIREAIHGQNGTTGSINMQQMLRCHTHIE